jgi:hypothetical protein
MKENTILNKVREILGMEIELEQKKLEDGTTVIEAESFEAGAEVFIVTEDEQKIALPVGEYKMEEDMILVVKEEGKIAEIKEKEKEEAEKEEEKEMEEKEKEEAGYDKKEEEMKEDKPKKTVESIVKETFFAEIEALKKENEELKAEIELLSKPKAEETVELSEEVKEDLTPATEPITHNPENKEEKEVFKFNAKRPKTLLDNIFEKLNK